MDNLFHALVENSSQAIAMIDASGHTLFASESATRIGGYTLKERVGRSAFEMIHPDDVAATRADFEACLRRPGVPVPGELRVRHKDGACRHLQSIAVNHLDDPAVKAIVVNYRDVTDLQSQLFEPFFTTKDPLTAAI